MIDVYGITTDLKVYYCRSGVESGVYGNIKADNIDPNTTLVRLNASGNNPVKNVVTEALAEIGITVDEELGVTLGNVAGLTEIIVDGTTCNMTAFSALSELTSLRKITLKNLTLPDLTGIENLPFINYVYFYNCDIKDYSKLATAYNLTYLYFYFPDTMNETTSNYQITKLGEAFHSATRINGLKYLHIVGNIDIYGFEYAGSVRWTEPDMVGHFRGYVSYNLSKCSNLSNISGLRDFASNIKATISELYLNNHHISNISCLSEFTNLEEVYLMQNAPLTSLTGLENKKSLLYLAASDCSFQNLSGIDGDDALIYLTVFNNSNLNDISSLKSCRSLQGFYAKNCSSLVSVEALKGDVMDDNEKYNGLDALKYLQLENCSNLQTVNSIALCDAIVTVFMNGCPKLIKDDVRSLESIFIRVRRRSLQS